MPKMPRALPSVAVLRETFLYDGKTGRLINRLSRTARRKGALADYTTKGMMHRMVYVGGALYYAHRVIWKLVYGLDPPGFLDHIDNDPLNNKIDNLRVAPHDMNMCNRGAPPHNTSGEKGVTHRKDNGKWRATVVLHGQRINIGQFESLESARAAVRTARRQLHGEYARN